MQSPRDPRPEPDPAAALVAAVYEELRRLAYREMAREPERATLQPTGLVHEAWLRLRAEGAHPWASRAQFFRAAAVAMRRILVERARRRAALRHGGALGRSELESADIHDPASVDPESDRTLLALDEGLVALRGLDPELGALVELRWFAGLTVEETAAALGRSERSVRRDWQAARLFLYERLTRERAARAS